MSDNSVEAFRAIVERTIHAQTCEAREHKPGTRTQCRFPTAEALRLLDAAPNHQLREALVPFAEFADPRDVVPADHVITQGSPLAKRQLTMGDCYRARAALQTTSPGQSEMISLLRAASLGDYRDPAVIAIRAFLRRTGNDH